MKANSDFSIAVSNEPAPGEPATRGSGVLAVGVFLACAAVYLIGNDRMPLFDRDEAWYAQISRTMLRSGDWVVPRFRGLPFPGKPVFAYWCQAISMKLLGQNVFAARFPSAISCLAVLAIVYWAVGRLAGKRRALWTMLVLGSSGLFIALAKLAMVDAELLLFITIAELCLAAIYGGKSNLWLVAGLWLATGLAVMVKGPVVVGILGSTLITLEIFDGLRTGKWRASARWWLKTWPWLAILIVSAVVGPWMYLMHYRQQGFIYRTVYENMIVPIFEHSLNGRSTLLWLYPVVIWPVFMPWSLLLILTGINAWRRFNLPASRFALAAVLGPLITIELVPQKLPHYLLPLFPPLAFLTADLIVETLGRRDSVMRQRGFRWAVMAWGIAAIAITSAPWALMFLGFGDYLSKPVLALLSTLGLIAAVVVGGLFFWRRPRGALLAMAGFTLAFALVFMAVALPDFAPLNASRLASQRLWDAGYLPNQTVGLDGFTEPSITYYLDGGGVDLSSHIPDRTPSWYVMTAKKVDLLSAGERQSLKEIGRVRSMSMGSARGSGWIVVLEKRVEAAPATAGAAGGP